MIAQAQATDPHTSPQRSRRSKLQLGVGVAVVLLFAYSARHFQQHGQLPFLHRENVWSIAIYEGSSPFELNPPDSENVPVLTAKDVSDVPALFVADPFMVQHADGWLMFMEVLNSTTNQGDIGLATSHDGKTWRYEQIVLDEPFHLSYPATFLWEGKWYMLPETSAKGEVRLYEAVEFPRRWRHVRALFSAAQPADPTLFRHEGTWWMFLGQAGTHSQLQLFYADDLLGEWIEHPQSPVVENDPDIARPGGPVIRYDSHLYRFGQDCVPKYGNQLRAFLIQKLTKQEYAEQPLDSPVLTAGSHSWNARGMHHSDPHRLPDGTWRAAVDGHKKTWILQPTP